MKYEILVTETVVYRLELEYEVKKLREELEEIALDTIRSDPDMYWEDEDTDIEITELEE